MTAGRWTAVSARRRTSVSAGWRAAEASRTLLRHSNGLQGEVRITPGARNEGRSCVTLWHGAGVLHTRFRSAVMALLVAFATSSVALAQKAPAPAAKPAAPKPTAPFPSLSIPFEKLVLENGLTVILHQDASLPLVAVNIWYHVGPINEPPGRSGFAHLFEHLMFEGSRHVGREFDQLLESVGATGVNGTTNWDRTNYFETVPREHLELALWIESDRMGFLLDVINQERLDVQRDVVKNERRQSFENAPYGPSALALLDALFPAGHPYHGAVIGSMADLSAATLSDVTEFFRAYYAPGNATLTLAGDFDPAQAKAAIQKYFGGLPGRARTPNTRTPTPTPPLKKPLRLVVDEPVELTKVAYGWIAPPAFTPDDVVLDVTMALLAGGRATRLYRRLVVEEKLALDVDASLDSNALASVATIDATAASGKSPEEIEKGIERVLEGMLEKAPTDAELLRAKRRLVLGIASDLELLNGHGGESGRAGMLQRFDHYLGDPGHLPKWLAQLEAVTAADVQRVIRQHLNKEARVTVITRPIAAKSPTGGQP
jgi:zinc protease